MKRVSSPGKGAPGAAGPSEALVPGCSALRGDPPCIVGINHAPLSALVSEVATYAHLCRCSLEGIALRAPDGMEILNLSLASS